MSADSESDFRDTFLVCRLQANLIEEVHAIYIQRSAVTLCPRQSQLGPAECVTECTCAGPPAALERESSRSSCRYLNGFERRETDDETERLFRAFSTSPDVLNRPPGCLSFSWNPAYRDNHFGPGRRARNHSLHPGLPCRGPRRGVASGT